MTLAVCQGQNELNNCSISTSSKTIKKDLQKAENWASMSLLPPPPSAAPALSLSLLSKTSLKK